MSDWRDIDRRNTQDLNGESIVKTISCGNDNGDSFRFIMFRQTGKNARGDDYLMLSRIEFFGNLFRDSKDS